MKTFHYFSYAVLVLLGAIAFGITFDGHIVIICIACGGWFQTTFGIAGLVLGAVGIARLATNKEVATIKLKEENIYSTENPMKSRQGFNQITMNTRFTLPHIFMRTFILLVIFIFFNKPFVAGQNAPASSPHEKPKVKSAFKIRKTELHDLRHLQRIEKRHCRKEERISRYSRKKQNGRVRTFQYDFKENKFTCETNPNNCGCSDCSQNCAPPFEIDEMDGIKIVFNNVNPFLYSVNLYELQGDQISNENLTANNWNKNLTINFNPLQTMTIDRNGLSATAKATVLKLRNDRLETINKLESKRTKDQLNRIVDASNDDDFQNITNDKSLADAISTVQDIEKNIQTVQNDLNLQAQKIAEKKNKLAEIEATTKLINQEIENFKKDTSKMAQTTNAQSVEADKKKLNDLNSKNQIISTELQQLQKDDSNTQTISDLDKKINVAKATKQSIFKKIKDDATAELADVNTIQKKIDDLTSQLKDPDGLAALENQVRNDLIKIQDKIQEINQFVSFHNHLIYVVHLPENNSDSLRKTIRESLLRILHINEGEVMVKYLKVQGEVYDQVKRVSDGLNELISLDTDLTKNGRTYTSHGATYNIVQTKLNSFQKDFDSFDGTTMIGQINFMIKMVNKDNFQVTYETHSIAENADFIRYRVEFKPNVLDHNIPQGVAPANLEISFKVRGGWKYDVSSGFVLDIGLKDPSYYFDKTSDPSGKTVTLRQFGDGGNVTPSLAAFLNGYKRTSSNVKIGGAFGLGLSNNARFRLYLGPSIILGRKERIVISSGVSFGAISRLSNGYSVSQVLNNDSTLPTEVPTVLDKFQFGGYFGIGFNLTGKSNQSFLQNLKFK